MTYYVKLRSIDDLLNLHFTRKRHYMQIFSDLRKKGFVPNAKHFHHVNFSFYIFVHKMLGRDEKKVKARIQMSSINLGYFFPPGQFASYCKK